MSRTFMTISEVPDLGGDPPSTAVRRSFMSDCFSRSRFFCSTNSAETLLFLKNISIVSDYFTAKRYKSRRQWSITIVRR
uniref:Uncharacterized protein n=1 Tax=Paramormyrops kingsleyae TaxID=1676925 RepID=A0A3B3TA07_9TELE